MSAFGLFVDIHRGSSANRPPLPVREAELSPCAGRLVCLSDWALLLEMCMERMHKALAGTVDVYPHGVLAPTLAAGVSTHVAAVEYAFPSSGAELDPDWTPTHEYYEDERTYDPAARHGLVRTSWSLLARIPAYKRLRSLDNMRRLFLDIRRASRYRMTNVTVSLEGPHANGVNAYGVDTSGTAYSYNDISGGSVTTDLSARFHARVIADGGFAASPRWILGRFVVSSPAGLRYRTVWLPIDASGRIGMSGATADACRAVFQEEFGGTGGAGRFVQFGIYRDTRSAPVVVYDITFPYDRLLNKWMSTVN